MIQLIEIDGEKFTVVETDDEFLTVQFNSYNFTAAEGPEEYSTDHNALLVEHYHASVDYTGTAEHRAWYNALPNSTPLLYIVIFF